VYLALFLTPSVLGYAARDSSSSVTKSFKFKDDLFLKFHPLDNAIGPSDIGTLMQALEDFAPSFKRIWKQQVETKLLGGGCKVDRMRVPTFSYCEWKFPDRYDTEELPIAGQCYAHEDDFIQRVYYNIEKLVITCDADFDYADLDRQDYIETIFEAEEFVNLLNPPESLPDPLSLFSALQSVEASTFDECNAELYINRYVDVPVFLKCLDLEGYGPDVANQLIEALDLYFVGEVIPALSEKILLQAPTGHIYNIVSPYESDREYGAHGSWYTGGNLVNQRTDCDGVLVTEFTYGFDVIWFKPTDFDCQDDQLLNDVPQIIQEVFQMGSNFLDFVKSEFPGVDIIQDASVCDVVDPDLIEITFAPSRQPTVKPTSLEEIGGPCDRDSQCVDGLVCNQSTNTCVCNMDTNEGCSSGLFCRFSCVFLSNAPKCFDDQELRDCEIQYGPGHICYDANQDGVIDALDKASGCAYFSPTASPSTDIPTKEPSTASPVESPTVSPSVELTMFPTIQVFRGVETLPPTDYPAPSPRPTCPKCEVQIPYDTKEDECPLVTSGTCGGGNRGDGICPFQGYCCSRWGWCGTTDDYCEDDFDAPTPSTAEAAPPAPTISIEAGMCGAQDVGDGLCPGDNMCCSDFGYCGAGENYCFSTRVLTGDNPGVEDSTGKCGAGGIGDGLCPVVGGSQLCCSQFGFCGKGDLYCTGNNQIAESDVAEGEAKLKSSPVPSDLRAAFGFRCGLTEADARSNCKPECTHHTQCDGDEECWGVQLNYCHTFEEGEHPICTDLDKADNDSRCGVDETSARSHCGAKCTDDSECATGEFCYPVLSNYCTCHENNDKESPLVFAKAQALISPYFVESEIGSRFVDGEPEGVPRSSAKASSLTIFGTLLSIGVHFLLF